MGGGCGMSASECSRCRLLVEPVQGAAGVGASLVVHDKDRDKLLEEEALWSAGLVGLRRANNVLKEAIDDRRRRELRRDSACVSLEPLLRLGMMALLTGRVMSRWRRRDGLVLMKENDT